MSRKKVDRNHRWTIERTLPKERVRGDLKDCQPHPDPIAAFLAKYEREYMRPTRGARKARASAGREPAQVQRKVEQIVGAV